MLALHEDRATILVVDDETAVALIAGEMLKSVGYRVHSVDRPVQALDLLETDPDIELLFTDVSMPGIHGFMLADMAKARRPALKVMYATGYAALARELSAQAGEVYGPVIYKPYKAVDLERALRGMFDA